MYSRNEAIDAIFSQFIEEKYFFLIQIIIYNVYEEILGTLLKKFKESKSLLIRTLQKGRNMSREILKIIFSWSNVTSIYILC